MPVCRPLRLAVGVLCIWIVRQQRNFYRRDSNGSHNHNVLGVPAITFVINSVFEASRSIPNSYDL